MLATNNFNGHSGECSLNISLDDTDGMRLRGIYPTSVNEILWYHDLKKRRKKKSFPTNLFPDLVMWDLHLWKDETSIHLLYFLKYSGRWLKDGSVISSLSQSPHIHRHWKFQKTARQRKELSGTLPSMTRPSK